jgi:hypothetical protein
LWQVRSGSAGLIGAMEEINIWRAAQHLVTTYGEEAWSATALRADRCSVKGDLEGEVVWKRVLHAVEELQRLEPHWWELRN